MGTGIEAHRARTPEAVASSRAARGNRAGEVQDPVRFRERPDRYWVMDRIAAGCSLTSSILRTHDPQRGAARLWQETGSAARRRTKR